MMVKLAYKGTHLISSQEAKNGPDSTVHKRSNDISSISSGCSSFLPAVAQANLNRGY